MNLGSRLLISCWFLDTRRRIAEANFLFNNKVDLKMPTTTRTILLSASSALASLLIAFPGAAQDNSSTAAGDLAWSELMPGVSMAVLWGDPSADGQHGKIIKIAAGIETPRHSHTADYNAVTIQGSWVHSFDEGDEHILPPGSHAFQKGTVVHGDRCDGDVDCLIFVTQNGPGDFIPAP